MVKETRPVPESRSPSQRRCNRSRGLPMRANRMYHTQYVTHAVSVTTCPGPRDAPEVPRGLRSSEKPKKPGRFSIHRGGPSEMCKNNAAGAAMWHTRKETHAHQGSICVPYPHRCSPVPPALPRATHSVCGACGTTVRRHGLY
eukprot:351840-Chlamydomonas_euryale.AAC.4